MGAAVRAATAAVGATVAAAVATVVAVEVATTSVLVIGKFHDLTLRGWGRARGG